MEESGKEPTLLQQVLQKLGHKNGVVKETLRRLSEKGINISKSTLYQTLDGRGSRQEYIDVFLEVAEETTASRRQSEERARQLLTEN